ncbi:hypothetical protein JB92DRAFT_3103542 [Gautieria morchelliformis]|nr:hypothetical protein JB92DRAFT_3103542 [Gautieria morchelliformis]
MDVTSLQITHPRTCKSVDGIPALEVIVSPGLLETRTSQAPWWQYFVTHIRTSEYALGVGTSDLLKVSSYHDKIYRSKRGKCCLLLFLLLTSASHSSHTHRVCSNVIPSPILRSTPSSRSITTFHIVLALSPSHPPHECLVPPPLPLATAPPPLALVCAPPPLLATAPPPRRLPPVSIRP